MDYIKVINLKSGETKYISTFEYFRGRLEVSIREAYETIRISPQIGTVKDGSRLKYGQELEYILNNIVPDNEDWMKKVLDYTEKRKNEINSYMKCLNNRLCECRCIGLRLANSYCENLIESIRKYKCENGNQN